MAVWTRFFGDGQLQFQADAAWTAGGTAMTPEGGHGVWPDIGPNIRRGGPVYVSYRTVLAYEGSIGAFVQKLDVPIEVGESAVELTHVILLKDMESLSKYYDKCPKGSQNENYILKGKREADATITSRGKYHSGI